MMVNCPGCNTQYMVDERNVPLGGGRLTCTECGKQWNIAADTPPTPIDIPAAAKPADRVRRHVSSSSLRKPVNCPQCGHLFVPQAPGKAVQEPRHHILVVEDQNYFAELTRDSLGSDYKTTIVSDPAGARKALGEGKFDLVILDLSLEGDQDGSQLLESIRQHDLPVLIFTAREEADLYGGIWDDLKSAGATDILLKGINVSEDLRLKVKTLIDSHKT